MKNIFVKYGLLGYRHSWGYEFPISLFLKLLDISKRNNLIKLEEVSGDENFGLDASRTDIVTEMDVLKTIRL